MSGRRSRTSKPSAGHNHLIVLQCSGARGGRKKGIADERFREVACPQGSLNLDVKEEHQKKEYRTRNFVNDAGTLGYAAVEVDGNVDYIFISKTDRGVVLTMPGEQTAPIPFTLEGYAAITTVAAGSPVSTAYDAHNRALAGEALRVEPGWLESELPGLPQRALDVTMKIFEIVCESMERMMEGMGEAMGEAMDRLTEVMGEAMGRAMEGASEASGSALAGMEAPGAPSSKRKFDRGGAKEGAGAAKCRGAVRSGRARGKRAAKKKRTPPSRGRKSG